MKYSKFEEIIKRMKSHGERNSKAYALNIDLIDFCDDLETIISLLMREVYGEEGAEWFDWFCFEADFGEKDWSKSATYENVDGVMKKISESGDPKWGASDENGEPICYSIQSTWEYLEANYIKK
jgi:hypothetical protein